MEIVLIVIEIGAIETNVLALIEAERSHLMSILPDADPELLAEYEAQLIELNRETTDQAKLVRPAMEIMTSRNKRLSRLRNLYFSKRGRALSESVRAEMRNPLDLFSYEILREIESIR